MCIQIVFGVRREEVEAARWAAHNAFQSELQRLCSEEHSKLRELAEQAQQAVSPEIWARQLAQALVELVREHEQAQREVETLRWRYAQYQQREQEWLADPVRAQLETQKREHRVALRQARMAEEEAERLQRVMALERREHSADVERLQQEIAAHQRLIAQLQDALNAART